MLDRFRMYLDQGYDTLLLREWHSLNLKESIVPLVPRTAELFSDVFWLFLVVADWDSCRHVNEWLMSYGEHHDVSWKIEGLLNDALMHLYLHDYRHVEKDFSMIESLISKDGKSSQKIKFHYLKLLYYLELQEIANASDMLVLMGESLREQSEKYLVNWFNLAQVKVAIHSGNVAEALTLHDSFLPDISKIPQDWLKFFWHETWLELLSMMPGREVEVIQTATEYMRLAELKDYKLELKACHEAMLVAYLKLKDVKQALMALDDLTRVIKESGSPRGWLLDETYHEVLITLMDPSSLNESRLQSTIMSCREIVNVAQELNAESWLFTAQCLLLGIHLFHQHDVTTALAVGRQLVTSKSQWSSSVLQRDYMLIQASLHLLDLKLSSAVERLNVVREVAVHQQQHDVVFRCLTFTCLVDWFQKDFNALKEHVESLMNLAYRVGHIAVKAWSWSVITVLLSTLKRIKDAEKLVEELNDIVNGLRNQTHELDVEAIASIERNAWLAQGLFYLVQLDFENLDPILQHRVNPWLQSLGARELQRYLRQWFLLKILSIRRDLNRSLIHASADLQPSIRDRLASMRENPHVAGKEALALLIDATISLIDAYNGDLDNYLRMRRTMITKATQLASIVEQDRLAELLLDSSNYPTSMLEQEEKIALLQQIDLHLELIQAVGETCFSSDELLRKMLAPPLLEDLWLQ